MESHDYSESACVGKARRSAKADERGTTILEFAFVLVITFVLIFAIVDFARALYSYHFLSEVAREATRFASVRGSASCGASVTPCSASAADIQDYVSQIVPSGIDSTQLTVTPTWTNPTNMPVCVSTQNYPGCTVQVTVAYNFNFIFPFNFYNLPPISFMPTSISMSSSSQMNISR